MARHRDADDYEDDLPVQKSSKSWLDEQFLNTSMVLLVLFPLCCGMFALVFGIVGVVGCKNPTARQRAWMVLIISVIWIAIATVIQIAAAIVQNPDKF